MTARADLALPRQLAAEPENGLMRYKRHRIDSRRALIAALAGLGPHGGLVPESQRQFQDVICKDPGCNAKLDRSSRAAVAVGIKQSRKQGTPLRDRSPQVDLGDVFVTKHAKFAKASFDTV
jgi:hypothetical protein